MLVGLPQIWKRGVIAAALVLTSTSGGTSSAPASKALPGGTVTVRLNGNWTHFDPQHPTNTAGIQGGTIAGALYDSLITWSPDFKLVPYLAKSWEQTPTKLTFNLRNDATCTDGTPVTATVVKKSFERAVHAVGAAGRFGPPPYDMVANVSSGTFTFTLSAPLSDAIFAFAGNTGSVVCPAGLANPDSLTTKPAGSGRGSVPLSYGGFSPAIRSKRPSWKFVIA